MSFGRLRLQRVRPIAIVVAVAVLLALGGGWLWLRDSSLVAVQRVSVVGASGPDAGQIRSALTVAGRGMTTLDVNMGALRTAVSPFPVVKDLRVSTHFPHRMVIRVIEQVPVAVITDGRRRIAAAGDGTLLRDARASSSLPQIAVRTLPSGKRVTDPHALKLLAVLGAAPWQLLAHVSTATSTASHGVVVELREGPQLYFGDPTLLSAKWTAADDVLADPGSEGASYVDVSDPFRPAAGVTGGAGAAAGESSGAGADAAESPSLSAGGAAPGSSSTSGPAADAGPSSSGTSGAGAGAPGG